MIMKKSFSEQLILGNHTRLNHPNLVRLQPILSKTNVYQ